MFDTNGKQMTEETTTETAATEQSDQVQIGILGQYVKDMSFENPNAAETLQKMQNDKPQIDISVNVNARQMAEEIFEVVLKVSAAAKHDDKTAFVVELEYAGLFGAKNLPKENLQPFLLVEAPRLIFPFARRIVADATRDGGYPPLLLDPVDFGALYQQQMAAAAEKENKSVN